MNDAIVSLIERRRRQLLVHSYIYYELNDSIISDDTWSKWAVELEELQRKYPFKNEIICAAKMLLCHRDGKSDELSLHGIAIALDPIFHKGGKVNA